MSNETYPEIADGIIGNLNIDIADEMSTIGVYEPNIQVGLSRHNDNTVVVTFPEFSLGGRYENLRLLLDPDQTRSLADALDDAAHGFDV